MSNYLIHSAKGSTWKDHKYIKKIGDTYVYAKNQASKAADNIKNKVEESEKLIDDEMITVKKKTDDLMSKMISHEKTLTYFGEGVEKKTNDILSKIIAKEKHIEVLEGEKIKATKRGDRVYLSRRK